MADVLAQPRAIHDTLLTLVEQASAPRITRLAASLGAGRTVLTGMGSSLHALHPLCTCLNRSGHSAAMVETSELLQYSTQALKGSLLVVVSQSGRSAETVRLLGRRWPGARIIGVTNSPGSPLDVRAHLSVRFQAGEEFSVSSKTYVATLAALAWLGDALRGKPPRRTLVAFRRALPEWETYLGAWRSHVEQLASLLEGAEHLFLVGRGSSLAAAATGGLITKEAAHFHAEGMSAPAYRHGPFEMLSGKVLVLVFSGDRLARRLNLRLVQDVINAGGRAEVIGEQGRLEVFRLPVSEECVRPVWEILPVQMITLALAARDAREAGRFERVAKITEVE